MNAIPREQGRFLWLQALEAVRAGSSAIYVAMFDEVDEATAIFKGSNNPPVGESNFITYEGLQPDHYLWLTLFSMKSLLQTGSSGGARAADKRFPINN